MKECINYEESYDDGLEQVVDCSDISFELAVKTAEKSLSNGIEQYPQKTRYFSFGYAHEHEYKGKHLHNRVVVKITHPTPHFVMGIEFGVDWCNEYEDVPYFANQVYNWNTDTLTDVEI